MSRPQSSSAVGVRPTTDADLDALHALSQTATQEVGDIARTDFAELHALCAEALVAHIRGEAAPAGFLFALDPGEDYGSPNYRWFSARGGRFRYIDRVVVADWARGRGVGRALYAGLIAATPADVALVCEVNTVPPNPGSEAFHARIGFREVGRAAHAPGEKEVVFLQRDGF